MKISTLEKNGIKPEVIETISASLAESVGDFWLRQISKCVI